MSAHSTGASTHATNTNTNTIDSDSDSDDDHVPLVSNPIDLRLLPDITVNPLHEIATTAAVLGVLFGISSTALFFTTFKAPSIYIMALSLFHFLEYYVTARYNSKKVHKESFIINNGPAYTMAHMFALVEVGVEYWLFPQWKRSYLPVVKTVGFALIVVGQTVRFLAMRTAGQSFSHYVKSSKEEDHELVTQGVYSVWRHPSYFGFFWWAIGTQLVLVNPVGLVGFCAVLWVFFSQRIAYEEKHLVEFFGERYVAYRDATPVYIPFIS